MNRKIVIPIFIIFLLVLMFISVQRFMVLWHNIDTAYNAIKDPIKEQTMYDEHQPGVRSYLKDFYILSMQEIKTIIFYMIGYSAVVGLLFGYMWCHFWPDKKAKRFK